MLSLEKARKTGQLQEFIAEQEAGGVGPIARFEFEAMTTSLIKARRLADQTSRSASDGNLSETQTRRDTDSGASG